MPASDSLVRDPSLAPRGRQKIEWARTHMPVVGALESSVEFRECLGGLTVLVCCHLEAKTARLAMALANAGARVRVAGSNPLSTQDDVAAALAEADGVSVYAWHGATSQEYDRFIEMALGDGVDLIMDDGGDVVAAVHTRCRHLLPRVIGGSEETTTGVVRLRAMHSSGELAFPMYAVNDAQMKHLIDNRYGTGQSALDGIMRTTNLCIAGSCVVIAGYGQVGRGLAARARGLGARVIVTEVDPVAAFQALMDGFEVMSMERAAGCGHIFITATGCNRVIRGEHFKLMRDGAILANAGHFDVEISIGDLEAECAGGPETVRANIDAYTMPDGRRIYLLARGRLVNLAAADGHPVEIMDLSFALQMACLSHMAKHGRALPKGVHSVPHDVDEMVARLVLDARSIGIDALDDDQRAYLAAWQHGTC